MSKKAYVLATSIIGGAATIVNAIITYCQPGHATAIVAAVGIGTTAAVEILQLFVDDTKDSK